MGWVWLLVLVLVLVQPPEHSLALQGGQDELGAGQTTACALREGRAFKRCHNDAECSGNHGHQLQLALNRCPQQCPGLRVGQGGT